MVASSIRANWAFAVVLFSLLLPLNASVAQPQDQSSEVRQGIDQRYYPVIRQVLEDLLNGLRAVDPQTDDRALRPRLLVEALEIVNQTLEKPLPSHRLLELPSTIKDDVSLIVSELLGGGVDLDSILPKIRNPQVPSRIKPFEHIFIASIKELASELQRKGLLEAEFRSRLNETALRLCVSALAGTGRTADLSPDERSYMFKLVKRVLEGGPIGEPDSRLSGIQDDLEALFELMKRLQSQWQRAEPMTIADRIERLQRFGLEQMELSFRRRGLRGPMPRSVNARVRSLANQVAQGALSRVDPLRNDPLWIDRTDEWTESDPHPSQELNEDLDSSISGQGSVWKNTEDLARAVNLGMVAAGVDSKTRNQTLKHLLKSQIERNLGLNRLTEKDQARINRLSKTILEEFESIEGKLDRNPNQPCSNQHQQITIIVTPHDCDHTRSE